MVRAQLSMTAAWCVVLVGATQSFAQQIDGVVNVGQLSHTAWLDRRPLCPMNRESFDVLFQTAANDLTGARVGVDDNSDGAGIVWVDAVKTGTRGTYDMWKATVPTSASAKTSYVIDAVDGSAHGYLTSAGTTSTTLPATANWWPLDFDTLEHAPIGATPTAAGTVFKVWAPGATTATVRGVFNNWGQNTMTKRGEHFIAYVAGAVAGQKYKFFFNNSLWKPDARARMLDGADGYNSVIVNPLAYQWENPNFIPAERDRWVVYQLHVGSFSGLNDPKGSFTRQGKYREVGDRAAHLQELGINAVMLNPINEFPGTASGGYNGISMWAFESGFGTPDDLKYMIDKLHGRGIAVLLDVTWNHFGSSDNFLWNYDGTQIYFDSPTAVDTPWGAQANVDRAAVYSYFLDSVDLVLGEYKMDGFRQDALDELTGQEQAIGGQNLIKAMMERTRRRYSTAHNIAEIYNNSAWNTSSSGIDMNGQYHEAFKNPIQNAVAAAASGDPNMSSLAAGIDGSGPFVFGDRVLNYFELHDDAWPLNNTARAVKEIDTTFPHNDAFAKGRTKLANGLTIMARGMPAILQGTEWLESNGWESEKIDWSKKTTYSGVFQFYKDLIRLRTTIPSLFANTTTNVYHVNESSNVLAFQRTGSDGRAYVVVANFSNTTQGSYLLGLPRSGRWGVVMNSEDTIYQGTGQGTLPGCVTVEPISRDGYAQRTTLSIPAHGMLLLQAEPEYATVALTQTPSGTLCAGASTTMIVSATGFGPFTYQWKRDGVALANEPGHIAGATTSTLNLTNINPADAGEYTCVVSRSCIDAVSPVATLSMCAADFNCDGFLDFTDFDEFVIAFESGAVNGDFNGDGFLDFTDFDAFVGAFEAGC